MPVVALTLLAIGPGASTMAARPRAAGDRILAFLVSSAADTGIMASIIGSAQLVVGVAALVLAFGFWFQRSWAWGFALVVFGLSLIVSAASIAAGASHRQRGGAHRSGAAGAVVPVPAAGQGAVRPLSHTRALIATSVGGPPRAALRRVWEPSSPARLAGV